MNGTRTDKKNPHGAGGDGHDAGDETKTEGSR